MNLAGQTSERQQVDGSVEGRGMTAQNHVCAVFLCAGTHHGFSWLPGNKSKNSTMYITRQAWGWAVSVSGVLFDVEVPCIVKENGETLRSRDTIAQKKNVFAIFILHVGANCGCIW